MRSRWAFYGLPILFCLALHWLALKTWFRADDFAWLGLPLELHSFHDLLMVLFEPRAQGTIRTLSERLYFLVFTSLFGLNATPFRIFQFLTAFADIALIAWITRRLTGSKWAGFFAALLWPANAGLSMALGWSSGYNEPCCALCFLLAFFFFLRFLDTGQEKFWLWQWIVFLLGFGALELIVTYPALVALYCLLFAPQHLRRAVWLFIPSALFTIFHFLYVPKTQDPTYAMHIGPGMLAVLAKYWTFAVSGGRDEIVLGRPVWFGYLLALLAALAVVFLLIRRTRLTLFFAAWFLLVILPVLPLKNHFTEYYVTIPAIGLSMLAAYALVEFPLIAAPLVIVCAAAGMWDGYVADRYFYESAREMKRLVLGLREEHSHYAGKTVLLSGVTNDLFWSGFFDDPFRLLGISQIALTPGTEKAIDPHPEWGGIARFTMPLDEAMADLASHKAVVFAVASDGSIKDVTGTYTAIASAAYLKEHRDFIDVGLPMYARRLGPGWYEPENGFRWMSREAMLEMGGPTHPGERLYVSGYAPAPVVAKGPLALTVSVDNHKLGTAKITEPAKPFSANFALPDDLVGKYAIDIHLTLNHTTQIGTDTRSLGLIFGKFRIK